MLQVKLPHIYRMLQAGVIFDVTTYGSHPWVAQGEGEVGS